MSRAFPSLGRLGPVGVTALVAAGCVLIPAGAGAAQPPAVRQAPEAPRPAHCEPATPVAGTPSGPGAPHTPAPASGTSPAPGTPHTAARRIAPGPDTTPPPLAALLPGDAGGCPSAGAASLGDPYFSDSGNGGYDATDYQVALRFRPADRSVDATVAMTATALQDLSAFDLDYRGPQVLAVSVDGTAAAYRRAGGKLVVTPATALPNGAVFRTVIRYAGVPSPAGSPDLGTYGWVPTRDGAIVVAEPDGAPTWMPVNDHPSDKATYTFTVTVPRGLQVLANGEPDAPVTAGPDTTYTWHERLPMASYLATVAIGRFQVRRGTVRTATATIPVITAVDPAFARDAARLYATTAAATAWASTLFGPYPFHTVGGIVDDPRLDYALETQERPIYGGFAPDDDFVVHELAHQWFGDSVGLRSWRDIWLNEGFATYAEWLWHERGHQDSAARTFKRYYQQPANSPIFNPPPGRPGRSQLFSFSVYIRGAMCLQALRERVGSPAFFRILRSWAAEHQYGTATTGQFQALAERISHRRLGPLFDAWLTAKGKPRSW